MEITSKPYLSLYNAAQMLLMALNRVTKTVRFKDTDEAFRKSRKGLTPNKKLFQVRGVTLIPLTDVHHRPPMNFSQDICNYTAKGREKIHAKQRAVTTADLMAIQMYFPKDESMEFRSNALSRYVAQYGKCYVTGEELTPSKAMAIRIKPKDKGGTDSYSNIVIVSEAMKQFLTATLYRCKLNEESKTVTDVRRELDLTITEIRMEIREMRKLLAAAM